MSTTLRAELSEKNTDFIKESGGALREAKPFTG
jgi:hypothetical protein